MSAFGALPLDAERKLPFEAVVASSNKCLEAVPGMGFCIARRDAITAARGNAPSLSLDLHDQWDAMEKNGQWRFTPPVHCILALIDRALDEFEAEGMASSCRMRGRYRDNLLILVQGLRALGFETLLPDALQAPIIVTVHMPADPKFHFQTFYDRLNGRRIRDLSRQADGRRQFSDRLHRPAWGRRKMRGALAAIAKTLADMGVTNLRARTRPAAAPDDTGRQGAAGRWKATSTLTALRRAWARAARASRRARWWMRMRGCFCIRACLRRA